MPPTGCSRASCGDEARQVVTGNRVARIAVAEEIKEPFEHGLVLPMSTGFLQRFDLLQVLVDGYKPGNSQLAAFQFMALAALRLQCLGGSDAGALATTRSAYVPLDIVAAVGDGVPVVVAFGITGDGKHLPEPVNLDAFDDVDSRHSISSASRILADSKGDSMRRK
jgi:hypothetical protein